MPDKYEIIAALHKAGQRATYGALADVVGGIALEVMKGEPMTHPNSWIVAAKTNTSKNRKKDWPTGYPASKIDQRIHEGEGLPTIKTGDELLMWLQNSELRKY